MFSGISINKKSHNNTKFSKKIICTKNIFNFAIFVINYM